MTWTCPTELPYISDWKTVGFDTETKDPDLIESGPGFVYDKAHMIGFSVYTDTGYNEYFPIRHLSGQNFDGPWKLWLKSLMAREDIEFIMANARYDLEVIMAEGIQCKGKVIDIQVVEALIDEDQNAYSLDAILKRRGLETKNKGFMENELVRRGYIVEKGRNRGKADYSKLEMLEPEWVAEYAKYDPKGTYDIYMQQKMDIERDELQTVFDLECELTPILFDMRWRGVPVNISGAEHMNEHMNDRCKELSDEIRRQSGMNIDPFSTDSIAAYLDTMGIYVPQTEKENNSVTNEYLQTLDDPVCKMLSEYRGTEKIRRDFVEGMVLENSYKGRIHPQYYQTRGASFMSDGDANGTRSGRIGAVNPNILQIPRRNPIWGKQVRALFLPEQGQRWCKADYNQQEPRILLHFAYLLNLEGASKARQIYIDRPETDYHQMMTDNVNVIRENKPITRGVGKDINLGLAYGLGKAKMADKLHIPQTESNALLLDYHEVNPFVRKLQQKCIDVATMRGYVKTILGRRRRFNKWEAVNWSLSKGKTNTDREQAEADWGRVRRAMVHKALNSIVQGSAADQMKKALIGIYKAGISINATIYDETGTSVDGVKEALMVRDIMLDAIIL
jgi:DNA polymerase I-like protein with 3'-5' exonuclease and polymerase domains